MNKIKFFQILSWILVVFISISLYHVVLAWIHWFKYGSMEWTWSVLWAANLIAKVIVDNYVDDWKFERAMRELRDKFNV